MEGIHGAGKGDAYRRLDYDKWSRGWDAIFGRKKKKKKSPRKKGRDGGKQRHPSSPP